MKNLLKAGSVAAFGVFALAACGGGGDGNGGGYFPPGPVVVKTPQENIGVSFAQIFNKDANSDVVDPVPDSAVPALTLTSEPVDIPN